MCPVAYEIKGKQVVGVGCSACNSYDGPSGKVTIVPQGEVPGWSAHGFLRGAFTGPGRDEVFVTFAGACNAKHVGSAIFVRKGDRWTVASDDPVSNLGSCVKIPRPGKTDLIACRSSSSFYTSWIDGAAVYPGSRLLTLTRWDVEEIATQYTVKKVEASDEDKDGKLDFVVSVEGLVCPAGAKRAASCKTERARLVYRNDGTDLVATPKSAADAQRITARLPPWQG